jgi:hypothetical protein
MFQIVEELNHICKLCSISSLFVNSIVNHLKLDDFHVKQFMNFGYWQCCNLSLGLATKARVCKVAGQEGSKEFHNILLRV